MKKFAQLSVVVALTVFAVACGGTEDNNNNNVKKQDQTSKVDDQDNKDDKSDDKTDDKKDDDKKDDDKEVQVLDEEDELTDIFPLFEEDTNATPNVVTSVSLESEEVVVTVTKPTVVTATAETEEEVVTVTTPASTEQQLAANALLAEWKKVKNGNESSLKSHADAVRDSLGKNLHFTLDETKASMPIDGLTAVIAGIDGTGPKKCILTGNIVKELMSKMTEQFANNGKNKQAVVNSIPGRVKRALKKNNKCVNNSGKVVDLSTVISPILVKHADSLK